MKIGVAEEERKGVKQLQQKQEQTTKTTESSTWRRQAHTIAGIQMASSAIKNLCTKKGASTQRRMKIKEAEWETTFEHTKCSFSCSLVSLALSQAVIILHGAPCYAISAVKHQRKWIIENMIFWSGGVKEPFPLPAVVSPAVHWSVGSLNLSQSRSLRHRTNTLH